MIIYLCFQSHIYNLTYIIIIIINLFNYKFNYGID
nr:MAG TPA: hypothetical protein [Caudoviricetes sp.]DAR73018.1 MAG TPA: hypothetical protein [Caudoviricetes sp.]